MIGVTLVLVIILFTSAWLYNKYRHSYWASKGIPTPPITPFLGHEYRQFNSKQGSWVYDHEVYHKYGGNYMAGLYQMFFKPYLTVGDPEIIRAIYVKDFDHFIDRRVFTSNNDSDAIVNEMLSNVNGDKWRNLRSIVSPTFSSGKMKNMFETVCKKADILVKWSLDEAAKNSSKVEMKKNYGRFTIDSIAICAFGIDSDAFVNEDAMFPKQAAKFFEIDKWTMFKFFLMLSLPKLVHFFKIKLFSDATYFFDEVVKQTIAARRKGERRGDFLDLLLDAQSEEKIKKSSFKSVLDDIAIASQSALFIIAGYDTTATTLSFATYLLAKYPEHQQRLREEIQSILDENNGELSYNDMMEAKFLDACVMETLRMYPPAPSLERVCTKRYQIPGTELILEPGMLVQTPAYVIHHDEKYWPEPEVFNPDRFMPENKDKITNYTHMPFGLGPRNCIAMRFALMEVKIGLAKMITAADMRIAPGHEELTLSTGIALLSPVGGVHLLLEPLKEE